MKMFTQAALVSAMALSSSAFAMQAMTEDAMSATTGQDGITVKITPPTSTVKTTAGVTTITGGISIDQVIIHDKDGLTAAQGNTGTPSAGAILIGSATNPIQIAGGAMTLTIDADGGNATGTSPFLNVGVHMDAATIKTGDIAVGASNRATVGVGTWDNTKRGLLAGSSTSTIMNSIVLKTGATDITLKLGNTPAGSAMIGIVGSMTGGLTIQKLQLNDMSGTVAAATPETDTKGGALGIGQLTVLDNGTSGNLTFNASVDINTKGILVTSNTTTGMDILMEDFRVGSSAAATATPVLNFGVAGASAQTVGDIEIVNLKTAGSTILISGH